MAIKKPHRPWAALILCAIAASGCSINRLAVDKVGDALAGGGGAYASDDDPELVGAALPFGLKLIESLLVQSPEHRGLLAAASSGYTQYAYGFVQMPAEQLEQADLQRSWTEKDRARRLYLRARDYGLRGLALGRPGFAGQFRDDPVASLRQMDKRDVEFLYWTAASWGAAIGLGKDDPSLVSDLSRVEALTERALSLDPAFGEGALQSFMIAWEMVRAGADGDPAKRATARYREAVLLSGGLDAGPHVTYAESVCLAAESRQCLREALESALAVNVDANPSARLANTLMQRRARWLLEDMDRLILPPLDDVADMETEGDQP
jgi:predicted anti-sigma-YlaC factor YlaD